MDVNRILSELDAEIAHLQSIRAALTGVSNNDLPATKGKRGRPKGSKNGATAKAAKSVPAKSATKRHLSPEGRKRIADAMKRRWAERRKQAAK